MSTCLASSSPMGFGKWFESSHHSAAQRLGHVDSKIPSMSLFLVKLSSGFRWMWCATVYPNELLWALPHITACDFLLLHLLMILRFFPVRKELDLQSLNFHHYILEVPTPSLRVNLPSPDRFFSQLERASLWDDQVLRISFNLMTIVRPFANGRVIFYWELSPPSDLPMPNTDYQMVTVPKLHGIPELHFLLFA